MGSTNGKSQAFNQSNKYNKSKQNQDKCHESKRRSNDGRVEKNMTDLGLSILILPAAVAETEIHPSMTVSDRALHQHCQAPHSAASQYLLPYNLCFLYSYIWHPIVLI